MAKAATKPGGRPELPNLLAHPIRKSDNGEPPAWAGVRANGGAPATNGGESYPDWYLDHKGKARFYLCGFTRVRSITRQGDAKYFHSLVDDAIKIAQTEGWDEIADDAFIRVAGYNQFRSAINLQRPMFFENAVQVVLACECALAAAIAKGKYPGKQTDVYTWLKIVPACYNIDGFNIGALEKLRKKFEDYDSAVLQVAGQSSKAVLDKLAEGGCVTRKTARAIRWKTLQVINGNSAEFEIGDVRGRPGRKRLGQKTATTAELVELDDPGAHAED